MKMFTLKAGTSAVTLAVASVVLLTGCQEEPIMEEMALRQQSESSSRAATPEEEFVPNGYSGNADPQSGDTAPLR